MKGHYVGRCAAAGGLALGVAILTPGCIVTAHLHAVATPQQDFVPCPPYSCGWNTGGMSAVAAVSPTDVWAVGTETYDSGRSYAFRAIIEHWDGKAWRVQSRPAGEQPGQSGLNAVSSLGPKAVWAVGTGASGNAMVLRFNGSSWRTQHLPLPQGTYGSTLTAVDAVTPADVWALGASWPPTGVRKPMLEHFDGHTWTLVRLPSLPALSWLRSIAAVRGEVIVVGTEGPASSGRPLVLQRTAGTWKSIPTGKLAVTGETATLTSAAFAGPDALWIVGHKTSGTIAGGFQTVAAAWRWHARRWTSFAPDPRIGGYLNSVATAGPDDVWASGLPGADSPGHQDGLLLTRWNGTSWTIAFSCPAPSEQSVLNGVSLTQGHVFSVGGGYKSIAVQN